MRRRTSCHASAAGMSHGANQCHGLSGPRVKCRTRSEDTGSGQRSLRVAAARQRAAQPRSKCAQRYSPVKDVEPDVSVVCRGQAIERSVLRGIRSSRGCVSLGDALRIEQRRPWQRRKVFVEEALVAAAARRARNAKQ